MKATIELKDDVFSEVEAFARRRGKSVNDVLVETISHKFSTEPVAELPGLMSVFGTCDHEAIVEVQRIIDEEFSKINPETWK